MSNAADIIEVSQVVLRERQARDRGWWDIMRGCYGPASTVRVSWFQGSGAEFVTRSQEMAGRGDNAVHRLHPPVVKVHGDRALVELPAGIELRTILQDVEVDLVSYARLSYRVQRDQGRWLLSALDPVYERDTLTPALPGAHLNVPAPELAALRPSYRMLAYVMRQRGYPIDETLYGDDRPDGVRQLERV